MSNQPHLTETRETPEDVRRWKRVYITVVIYTALLILGLWGFSQIFK